jgi:hypothetical protein
MRQIVTVYKKKKEKTWEVILMTLDLTKMHQSQIKAPKNNLPAQIAHHAAHGWGSVYLRKHAGIIMQI